jgi:hypothetical protein
MSDVSRRVINDDAKRENVYRLQDEAVRNDLHIEHVGHPLELRARVEQPPGLDYHQSREWAIKQLVEAAEGTELAHLAAEVRKNNTLFEREWERL